MSTKKGSYALPAIVAALALAACGGGGSAESGSSPQAKDGSPAAANAEALARALAEFQASLPPPETIDPVTLQKSLPPIDDKAEPTPLS